MLLGWLFLLNGLPAMADEPPLSARMHASWQLAVQARDRVVVGDLDGAKQLGNELANVGPDAEVPEVWRLGAVAVRERAETLSQAQDLTEAAVAIGRIGAACGTCHEAAGGPSLQGDEMPPHRWIRGEHGPMHAWGADWMWLGLISAQDTAWHRGTISLDEQPLDLRWNAYPPEETHLSLEQLVYTVLGRAAQVDSHEERGEVYGQYLATCDRCHSLQPPSEPVPEPPQPEPPSPPPAEGDKEAAPSEAQAPPAGEAG